MSNGSSKKGGRYANWDYPADIRDRIGGKLASLGLSEVGCRQFGKDLKGHGAMFADQVAYYAGGGRLIALSWSTGNGHNCWVGHEGDDPAAYERWSTLWSALGMDAGLDTDSDLPAKIERHLAYLDQFPTAYDEWFDFLATKLAALLSR